MSYTPLAALFKTRAKLLELSSTAEMISLTHLPTVALLTAPSVQVKTMEIQSVSDAFELGASTPTLNAIKAKDSTFANG